MTEQVARDPQYEKFADEFAEHAADGFYNAYIDRPACLDLLGTYAASMCSAGFLIERLTEPRPVPGRSPGRPGPL